MEALAFIPAPPAPKTQAGPKTQTTSRKEDDTSFAPVLSQAVANSKNTKGSQTKNPTVKTSVHDHKDTSPGKTSRNSSQAASTQAADRKDLTAVSSHKVKDPGKPVEKQPASTAQETTKTDPKKDPATTDAVPDTPKSDKFILGLLGYLLNIPQNTPADNLQKDAETLSNRFGIGKQESLNILQNISSLANSNSLGSQIIKSLAADPHQDTKLQKILELLSSDPAATPDSQDNVTQLLNDILQETNTNQSEKFPNISQSVLGAGKQPVSAQDTAKELPAVQPTDKQSLIAQQLQKILTAASGEKPAQIHVQPAQQNQAGGLDSLSSPLFRLTVKQEQQTSAIATSADDASAVPAAAGNALPASLVKAALPGENITEKHSNQLDQVKDRPFLIKVAEQDQKDSVKVQEKDAGLQNAGDHRQTGSLTSLTATDNSGNVLQPGPLSFGSTLAQSLQTGQHPAGTTASTHFSPWTTVRENSIINQVTQRFNFNANSPGSKLVVKLYPEELGELKIDIQMTDGAIKANIVTQTQQVQQVLEKYIPKLRSLMEQQGLVVDDILVTNTSDNVGGHELFQEDFVGNNDFSPPGKSIKQAPLSDITFDTAFTEKNEIIPGVNVTV
jgi:flagellar hook-length control protein FliK